MKIQKNQRNIFCSVVTVLSLCATTGVHAKIYKCENNKNETFYHDKPCPIKDKETEMRSVKDVENGYKPPQNLMESKEPKKGELTPSIKKSEDNSSLKEKNISKGSSDKAVSKQSNTNVSNAPSSSVNNAGEPPKPSALSRHDTDEESSDNENTEKKLPILSQEEKRQQLNIVIMPKG